MDSNSPNKTDAAGDGSSASTPSTPSSSTPASTPAASTPSDKATPTKGLAPKDATVPGEKEAATVAADAAKAPGGPTSGTEPAAQATAAEAASMNTPRSTPPMPASYEMPDDYADETWFDKTKAWVEQNPALAVVAATGIGLLVGRLVMGLAPDPEPPSLAERVEKRARELAKESKKGGRRAAKKARHYAHGAQSDVEDGWQRASSVLRDTASTVADRAEAGAERTKDVAESVADAVKVALAGVAAKAVDEWVTRVKN